MQTALTGDRATNEWEIGNPGFNGENASKINVSPLTQGFAEIWLGQRLVTAARGRRRPRSFHVFGLVLETDPGAGRIGVYHWHLERSGRHDRGHGLPTAAFPGFHHFDRLFALPRRRDWASVARPQIAP